MVNIDITQRVYNHILENPDKFNMKDWVTVPVGRLDSMGRGEACGTVACIAGHAAIMDNRAKLIVSRNLSGVIVDAYWEPEYNWRHDGAMALGIDESLASELFYLNNNQDAMNALRILLETESEEEVMDYISWCHNRDYSRSESNPSCVCISCTLARGDDE